jgi:hypothetical protein
MIKAASVLVWLPGLMLGPSRSEFRDIETY